MQMVKKSVLIFFAVWFTILLFMPKSELYYTVESALEKKGITLNEQSIEEGLFSLTLKDVTIYVKGIALGHVAELDFFTVLFYSSLDIDTLLVDEALHSKVPAKVQEASFTQHIFSPLTLSVDANGSFGMIEGTITNSKTHLDFVEVDAIGMIKSSLTKGEKGWFYEKSF